ncbi:MAG TPA: hypothetical protein VIG47_08075 [Gemmatimonadaceae bacterium]|jgi:hypothetical protein
MSFDQLGDQVDGIVEWNEDAAMNMAHEAMTVIERYVDDGHRRRDRHDPLDHVTLGGTDGAGVDSDGCPLVRFEKDGRQFAMRIVVTEVIE